METLKQLLEKKAELDNKLIFRKVGEVGNNEEAKLLDQKIKYVESFIEFIKEQDLDYRTELIILEKITGEKLRANENN